MWTKERRRLESEPGGLGGGGGAGAPRPPAGQEGGRRARDGVAARAARLPAGRPRAAGEARNLYTVAELIVAAALGREESRGAHSRNDFPKRDADAKHSVMRRGKLRFVDELSSVSASVGEEREYEAVA